MSIPWAARLALVSLFAAVALAAACGRDDQSGRRDREGSPPAVAGGHPFSGRWTVTGSTQHLPFSAGRRVATFQLRGTLHITGGDGVVPDMGAEILGLLDSEAGCTARCTWTDSDGDRIFSEIRGDLIGRGGRGKGEITEGTGKFAGATGSYSFTWASVIAENETRVDANTNDLSGTLRIPARPETHRGKERDGR